MKKGPQTRTVSLRLKTEEAVGLETQARERGFKNLNQYLQTVIRLLGPMAKPEGPVSQTVEQEDSTHGQHAEEAATTVNS